MTPTNVIKVGRSTRGTYSDDSRDEQNLDDALRKVEGAGCAVAAGPKLQVEQD
jgi:hypothetical protein